MMDRKRAAERRARESHWEREQRLALGRQRAAERRATESDERREGRLAQNRERLATKRALKAEERPSTNDGDIANGCTNNLQCTSGVGLTCLGAESTLEVLPVAVEAMATASSSAQQRAAAEQMPAEISGEGGEEKSGVVKQEVLEIKEFRAGK